MNFFFCLQGEQAVQLPLELEIALNEQVLVEGKHTIIHQNAASAFMCVCVCVWKRYWIGLIIN